MDISVCPSCVPHTSSDFNGFGLDVMMRIAASGSPFRVLLDDSGNILREYERVAFSDANSIARLWINSIANNLKFKTTNIHIQASNNDNVNVLANVCPSAHGRKLITIDEGLYHSDWDLLDAYDIQLIDGFAARQLCSSSSNENEPPIIQVLISQLSTMLARKTTTRLENFHNDELASRLETESYNPCDQARAGRSPGGSNPGSLDILIKSRNGRHISIIESLRESSCGPQNRYIAQHLDKLLNDYDYLGFKTNYLITYSEASNFGNFWSNYLVYMDNINNHPDFRSITPQIQFVDTEDTISEYSNIRIARGIYLRDGRQVEVIHIVANMYVP